MRHILIIVANPADPASLDRMAAELAKVPEGAELTWLQSSACLTHPNIDFRDERAERPPIIAEHVLTCAAVWYAGPAKRGAKR